jgi:uncharacterized protein (TIGR03086 family)
MTANQPPLAAAIDYFVTCLDSVRLTQMACPTPCTEWNVRDLLVHLDDSSSAFCQGAIGGAVSLDHPAAGTTPSAPPESLDPVVLVERVRRRARLVRLVWGAGTRRLRTVDIDTLPLPDTLVVGIASIEFAVHGWDLAQAIGTSTPMPDELAIALLRLSRQLLPIEIRAGLFAPPLKCAEAAAADGRLLAFLGRVLPSAQSNAE